MVSVLALLIAAPAAAAQLPTTGGDFYAPTNTVVQQPTAAQTKQAEEGDFYAATNGGQVSAQRATAVEKCTQLANTEYGPSGGTTLRRFNNDAYNTCMTEAGQTP
jgi:hypothetical protein